MNRKPAHAGCYTQADVQMVRDEFEEMLQRQQEEMTAEMDVRIRQVMASLYNPGSFTQLLVRGPDQQQGTSSSSAPAPQ